MAAGMRCFSSPKIWRLALLLHLALAAAGVEGQSTGSLGELFLMGMGSKFSSKGKIVS